MHFKYFNVLSLLLICLMSTSQVGMASASTSESEGFFESDGGVDVLIGAAKAVSAVVPAMGVLADKGEALKDQRAKLDTKAFRHLSLQNDESILVKLGETKKDVKEVKEGVNEGLRNDKNILAKLGANEKDVRKLSELGSELIAVTAGNKKLIEDTNAFAKQQADASKSILSNLRKNQFETKQGLAKASLGIQINTAKLRNLETISMSNKVNISYLTNRELSREFNELSNKQKLQVLTTTNQYDVLLGEDAKLVAIATLKSAVLVDDIRYFSSEVTRIASAASKLADALGLDSESKDIKHVYKAFDLGSKLTVGIVAVNPVAIIDAVEDICDFLLGGGGKSNYQLILEGQQRILEGQQRILKGQQKLSEQFHQYTKEILKGQQEILKQMKRNRKVLVKNQQIIISTLEIVISTNKDIFDAVKDNSILYKNLNTNCIRVRDKREVDSDYTDCIDGLEAVWSERRGTHYDVTSHIKLLLLDNYKKNRAFNRDRWAPLVQRVVDGGWGDNNLRLIDIITPIIKLAIPARALESIKGTRNINYKSMVNNICAFENCSYKDRFQQSRKDDIGIIKQFETLLHPEKLIRILEYLLAVGSDLDKVKEKNNSVRLKAIFNRALQSLNMAIAQQSLLSGDSEIPYIADQIFRTPISKEDRRKTLLLLKNNSILAGNVLLFEVDRQLRLKQDLPERKVGRKKSRVPLDASLDIENPFANWLNNLERYDALYMRSEFGDKTCSPESTQPDWGCVLSWNSEWPISSGKRPHVKLSYEEDKKKYSFGVPLPSAERLQSRALQHTTNLQRLLEIRQILFDVVDNLNPACKLDTTSIFWSFPDSIFDATRQGGPSCSN